MKRRITSVFLLAVIFTSMLNLALIVQPSKAETVSSSEALPAEDTGFADYEYSTLEGSTGTEEKPSGVPPEVFQGREDRWDFQNISEWSSFIYADGNRTRLIVGVRADGTTNLFELERIVAKHKAEIVNTVAFGGEIRALIVELLWVSVGGFVEDVRCEGAAAYIEPDVKVKVQFVPNDPYWNLQWSPQIIEADWAWNTTTGKQTVLVAVVDTGIDYTHSDLSNYVSLGYDWANNDTDPMDDYGHGTHCAGIIAATLNNSVGIAGLAQVQIMAEKVLDSWGYGYWDWIANGIIHATDSGADVISMSLGAYSDSKLVHEAVR
ncbi:S8 family serine peptidase, partial [Candidatus Bathyarchaeota archaeon]|nr:S8 family serine peptidase [Candidatus Bathyarchaeota archaeon]